MWAADFSDDAPRKVHGVEPSQLLGRHDLQGGAPIACQDVFPNLGGPRAPLALGEPHGDGTRLENDCPPAALGDTPIDELHDCSVEGLRSHARHTLSNLAELDSFPIYDVNNTERR